MRSSGASWKWIGFWLVIVCTAFGPFVHPQDSTLAKDILSDPVCLNGKVVYINRAGSIVLRTSFDYIKFGENTFSEGLAGFCLNDKYGFIDEAGQIIIQPSFDYIGEFSEGLAEVEVNDKWGYIDRNGEYVIKPMFDKSWPFVDGIALVGIQHGIDSEDFYTYKYRFIDRSGRTVVGKTSKPTVGRFDDADTFSEGLAPVKIGKRWGFIDRSGKTQIPFIFKEAKKFDEGLAPATKDGKKWGFIDKQGRFIVEPKFTAAESFSEGLAGVSTYQNGWRDWGFIDKSGKFEIQPTFFQVGRFHEGMVDIFWGGDRGFGFADRSGKIVIDKGFRGVSPFENGLAWVFPSEHGEKYILYGATYVDKSGHYVWDAMKENFLFGSKCDN